METREAGSTGIQSVERASDNVNSKGADATRIPWRLNLVVGAVVVAIYLSFYFGVFLLAARHFWAFALLLLMFLVATPTIWGLVHEGIHSHLLRQPLANRTASRVLCVLLGFSFDVVQFGHLIHHRYNGHKYDRPDRVVPEEPSWKSWLRHWTHLLGGQYLFTMIVSAVAFAPSGVRQLVLRRDVAGSEVDIVAIRRIAGKWFSDANRNARIRFDSVAGMLLILLSVAHYGALWPAVALAFCGRALVYSTLDNLPHYGVGGRGDQAAMNLSLPRWASLIVLYHNLHRVHHERPDLPWRAVPEHFGAAATGGNYLRAAIRQFAGPTKP